MAGYGADVTELRHLAQRFDDAASRLDAGRMTIGSATSIAAWAGPFAGGFRLQWESEHSRRIAAAVSALRESARTLRANADEQERASAATGVALTTRPRTRVVPAATSPAAALAWWRSLSPEEQRRLERSSPAAVGSLDGVPADARDRANRILLDRELRSLGSPLRRYDRSWDARDDDRRKALEQATTVLETDRDAHLLLLDDSAHPTKVVIALGDVDTADHVAVFTQGVASASGNDRGLTDPVDRMASLRSEAQHQLIHAGRGAESVATVIWNGYAPPPDLASGTVTAYAIHGAPALASFADGIRTNNPDAQITALGHSYGSYVTGLAAQRTEAFDDVVVFGSAGMGADDVRDLRVPAGHVYEAQAAWDPIPAFDPLVPGPDPSGMAHVVHLSMDAHDGLAASTGHGEYLKAQSTSQYDIALVVDGLDDRLIH